MKATLPRPVQRALNLVRRLPLAIPLFGDQPIEPAVRRFYSNYINSDDVVAEIGARMGDGTRVLAQLAGHVYAFEPTRQSFLVLLALSKKHKNVEAFNLALGDKLGSEMIRKDRSFSGVASFKNLEGVNYRTSERVSVARLSDLKFSRTLTSLVVDCEGSEVEALRGAQSLLSGLRSVLVETHSFSDGSTTLDDVVSQLKPFFSDIRVERAGGESWVLARKRANP